MMIARGDVTVINEPFSRGYYFGPNRVNDRYPDEQSPEDCDPEEVLKKILEAAEDRLVFFKDMAYHVHRFMNWEFLSHFKNMLLIRDPRLSIVSLYKKMPDFTREETGYESLAELASLVEGHVEKPFTMDGEVLRANPQQVTKMFCDAANIEFNPNALQWDSGSQENWDTWQQWYDEAARSKSFNAPAATFDEATMRIPRVAKAIEYSMPHYEALRSNIDHI